jgi:hydroxymethylpyrimidine pyrophosphatase-like HAD family hydrolase
MALYLFEDGDPFFYVLDRVLDTIIGIVVALAVNTFSLPRRRRKELLFVSAFDDTLMTENNRLSAYSTVELNRMIADGANFTVSTEQTPASLMEFFAGLQFNLPVIAMNGAVLYDISRNKYLHKIPIGRDIIAEIQTILAKEDAGCFYNTLIQDTLLIYFEDFKNMAMQEMFRDLRKSPYRNYVCGHLPDNIKILYLYIIDDSAKIARLVEAIHQSPVDARVRLVTGREKKYSGQSYLKIYDREATRQNMIAYLQKILDARAAITFGNEEGKYDFVIDDGNEDRVVRIMKTLYRPFIWHNKDERKK